MSVAPSSEASLPLGRAPLFAALGDDTRLRLVQRLCDEGPLSITHLSAGEEVTRQAITKHLEVLAGAGLASVRRVGRERVWRLEPMRLEEARYWLERISQQWDAAIERLRLYVEDAEDRPGA